ncbi:hypothetical protein [Kocuria atrinae]|uniref:hypothetical protein n=1 Tax=Kocuria atrinae TaxID=592377 RepID=UPI001CB8A1C1|nr:hypothetical protein [Kocuria atrinae]
MAGSSVDVLTGLTRHDRWPEVRAAALETVLLHARNAYEAVVVDTSFSLESDEEISLDTVAPRRNAATLSACAMADTMIVLGAADALGIPRLVKTLPDLTEVAPTAQLLVVINKLRKASVGRSSTDSVTEAWARFSPGHGIDSTLDWDPAACDEALLAGAVLAESAANSALRQQIARLAVRALSPQATSSRNRPHPGRHRGLGWDNEWARGCAVEVPLRVSDLPWRLRIPCVPSRILTPVMPNGCTCWWGTGSSWLIWVSRTCC